jgi:hypothetical protein
LRSRISIGRALERQLPRERLVEDRAHAVPICGGAKPPARSLLGRHVRDAAHYSTRRRLLALLTVDHEAEVEDHDTPVGRHADVGGLDVAMDLVGRVQDVEPLRELRQRLAQTSLVKLAAWSHEGHQVLARHELHREEPLAMALEQLTQRDEVRMRQILERSKLALEAKQRVGSKARQGLEGDARALTAVERLVDGPEASFPERGQQLEAPFVQRVCAHGTHPGARPWASTYPPGRWYTSVALTDEGEEPLGATALTIRVVPLTVAADANAILLAIQCV